MSVVVRPIRREEFPVGARVLASAFLDSPRFSYLVPDAGHRRAKLEWYWAASMTLAMANGQVNVAIDDAGDGIGGVAIWEAPGGEVPLRTRLASGMWMAPVRLGIGSWLRKRRLGPALAAVEPAGDHWYLNAIGVDPTVRRNGLAKALLDSMLSKIDEAGLPVFLDTSGGWLLPYYQSFGFAVSSEETLPNGIPLWGMVRPARE